MRRTLLLLATIAFVLIAAGGAALAAATITCPTSPLLCEGTNGDDRIEGSDGDDVHIFGYGGSDIIDANGGSEHVVGDDLTDRRFDGDDKLDGGPDPDRIYGFGGSDTLIGGPGEDYIDAQSYETFGASNTIRAGSENDQIDAKTASASTLFRCPRAADLGCPTTLKEGRGVGPGPPYCSYSPK